MQVALLQLSDIHIKDGEHPVLSRADAIKGAIQEAAPNAAGCLIVISGDVAYSGSQAQYDLAYGFLDSLRGNLLGLQPIKSVEFVAVPGNHDCDFENESDIRDFLLQDVAALYHSDIHPNSDRTQALVAVQKQFFAFEAKLTQSKELGVGERLSWSRLFKFDNYTILCNCFNTAWLSRKNELQSKLFLPSSALNIGSAQGSISACVFHHPYNWLDAGNYRILRDAVEQTSDIVFTGHEHVAGATSLERFSGERLHYVEGAALQGDAGLLDSAFNLLLVDFETGEQRVHEFKWNGDYYARKGQANWTSLIRNPVRERHLFRTNKTFNDFLSGTGVAFTHKRKRDLHLRDIFVYPDLQRWSVQSFAAGEHKARTVYSKDVLQHFRDTNYVFVTGSDDIGKTSLLKALFMDLSSSLVPVWLSGRDLTRKFSEHRFESLIAMAVEAQYDSSSVERFLQLDRDRTALFVDDFQFSTLNRSQQAQFVEAAKNRFAHIFVTASDAFGIKELRVDDPFLDFDNCQIKELGHRLRGRLIHRWLEVGRETRDEMETLDNEVRITERIVTTLLGKNVVPSTPLNVLSLLQLVESSQSHAVTDGSYGAMYEVLIKARLSEGGAHGVMQGEMRANYLSVIAYSMFTAEQQTLTETQLRRLNDEYAKKFDFKPDFPAIIKELVNASALEHRNGGYGFKYNHYYFYFVAKYFERALRRKDSPERVVLERQLHDMADRIHSEELANILLFYLYLTQDWELVTYLLSNAAKIYSNKPPADLKTDVAFVNKIYTEPPKMLISDLDIEQHQDEYRRRLDEAEEQGSGPTALDAKLKYHEELTDIHKVNIAFKTLQVLGQVLRSSAATLEADQRLKIASECYMLGLRTLRAILTISEANVQQLRLYLAAMIHEQAAVRDRNMTEEELLRITDEGVIWLTFNCAYSTLKKISYSVGHQHLGETYDRIIEDKGQNIAIRLTDLAIKLEYMKVVPEFEITHLRDQVIGNLFSYSLLRQMIGDYLYLYRVDLRTSQKLGHMFNIEGVTSAAFLLPDAKKA